MRFRIPASPAGRLTWRRRHVLRPATHALVTVFLAVALALTGGWGNPVSAAAGTRTLAALGDSYSSGEGSPPFDTSSLICRRSSQAWPRQLAAAGSSLQLDLFAACGGATTEALTEPFRGEDAQIDQLKRLQTPPDIVTVTIGGNDADFAGVIVSCYAWKCFWTGRDKRERNFITKDLPDRLTTSYATLKAAAPTSRILVVGYPELFPSSQRNNTCKWLSRTERSQLAGLNKQLNRVIRRAAKDAHVEFVPTDRALRGHEICTKDPWVAPVTVFQPGRNLSAHPTTRGQQAIAETVAHYLDTDPR